MKTNKRKYPWHVKNVFPTSNYGLLVIFIDKNIVIYSMKHLIFCKSPGIFARLKDVNEFNKVCVSNSHAVTWMIHPYKKDGIADEYNCIDLCPETMYQVVECGNATKEWPDIWITK